jgi:hypothetical protein
MAYLLNPGSMMSIGNCDVRDPRHSFRRVARSCVKRTVVPDTRRAPDFERPSRLMSAMSSRRSGSRSLVEAAPTESVKPSTMIDVSGYSFSSFGAVRKKYCIKC